LIARECSIDDADIETYLEPNYRDKFLPHLDAPILEAVGVVKDFLLENGFIDRDFSVVDWIDPRPLAEARRLEGVG